MSGCITALIFTLLNNKRSCSQSTQKISIIALYVVSVAAALTTTLALYIGGTVTDDKSLSSIGGGDDPEKTYHTVQLLEKKTAHTESTYEVGTYLNGTDFSSIGQVIASKIEQEWETYSAMTEEQRLLSSKLWGYISIQVDTWNECQEAIGFAVDNPLE